MTAINALLDAAAGVALRPARIRPAMISDIQRALAGLPESDWGGPYAVLLHAADAAVSRPELEVSVVLLNAARAFTAKMLADTP